MSKLSNLHLNDSGKDKASKQQSQFENFILTKMEEKAIEIQKIRNLFMNIDTLEKLHVTRNKIIQNFFSLEDDIKESYQIVKSTLLQNKDLAEQVEYLQNRSRELESKLSLFEKNSMEKEKTFHGLNKMVEMMSDKSKGDEEYIRDLEKRLLNYEMKHQNKNQEKSITPIKNSEQIMKIQDSLEFPEKECKNKMSNLNYKYNNSEILNNLNEENVQNFRNLENAENIQNVENSENIENLDSNYDNTYNYSELLSERENHKKIINDYVNDQLNNLTNHNNYDSSNNFNKFNSSMNFTSQNYNEQSINDIVKIREKNKTSNQHIQEFKTPTRNKENQENNFQQNRIEIENQIENENQSSIENSLKNHNHKITYPNKSQNQNDNQYDPSSSLPVNTNSNNQSNNQNYQPLSPQIEFNFNTISPNSDSNSAKLKANRVTDIIMKLNSNPDINSIVLKIFGEKLLDQLMSAKVEVDLLEKVEETIAEIEKLCENDIDEEEIIYENEIHDGENPNYANEENQYMNHQPHHHVNELDKREINQNNDDVTSNSLKNLISFSNTAKIDNNILSRTPYSVSYTPNISEIKSQPINNYKPSPISNSNSNRIIKNTNIKENSSTNTDHINNGNFNLNNSYSGKERPISDILSANNLLNSRTSNQSNLSTKNIGTNNYNYNLNQPLNKKFTTISGMTSVNSMSAMNALNTMNAINNINACYNYLTGSSGNNFNTISTAKKIDEPNFETSLRRYTGPSTRNESRVFKNYTRVKGDFFDPSLQRGGRSRVSEGKSRSKSKTRKSNYNNAGGALNVMNVMNPHIPIMNNYSNFVNTKLASPAKSYSNVSNASSNNYGYSGNVVGGNQNYNFQFSD